jgi:dihydroorotate dehydrogenase (fumarate)
MSNLNQTKFSGKNFSGFCLNASGVNNEIYKQLQKIADSGASSVMFKSCSIEPRKGNQAPKYIVKSPLIPGCTFNSMGLPNKGLEENLKYIQDLKEYTDKPLFISIVGIQDPLEEKIKLVEAIQKQGLADFIEVNLSCPNVEGEGILAYDFVQLPKYIKTLTEISGPVKVGFKLPPYTDVSQFSLVSKILLDSSTSFISSINTLPGLVIDPKKGSTVIKPKNGQGGLAGDYIKPIALYNVRQFFERVGDKIDIIGVGGVRSGSDAFEYLLAGASLVQVGTAFAHEGVGVFDKINFELAEILEEKGYSSILEARGKLRFL